MNEPFDLPVEYKGKQLLFPSQLMHTGYSHQFQVTIYGTDVLFEPDEEGSYRALIDPSQISKEITVELFQAVANGIAAVLK